MYFLLFLFHVNADKHDTFNSLLRSKVLETSKNFFPDSDIVLSPIFQDFERKSKKVFLKYQDQGRSQRNLKRMIQELEDGWDSSVKCTANDSCQMQWHSGLGGGLHVDLNIGNADEDEVLDEDLGVKELKQSGLEKRADISTSSKYLGSKIWRSVQTQKDSFRDMITQLMPVLYFLIVRFPLESLYKMFAPVFVDIVSDFTVRAAIEATKKLASDQDLRQAGTSLLVATSTHFQNPEFQNAITSAVSQASRTVAAGVFDETGSRLPSKRNMIGSILFVAVPVLISVIVRLLWLQNKEAE